MSVHAKNLIGAYRFDYPIVDHGSGHRPRSGRLGPLTTASEILSVCRAPFVELLQWHINRFCFDPQRARKFCAAQHNWPTPFASRWDRDPSRS